MGHQFIIEGDEAFALATELAALRGKPPEAAAIDAVREKVKAERELKEKVARVMALAAEIRERLPLPLPPSDLSHLYDDETGLPI